ncbi:hypothetical protein ACO0QE_004765 [Hanseniaspora vineae]
MNNPDNGNAANPSSHDMNNPQNPFSLLQNIGTPGFVIPPQLLQSLTPQQLHLIQQKHQQLLMQRQMQQQQQQQPQTQQQQPPQQQAFVQHPQAMQNSPMQSPVVSAPNSNGAGIAGPDFRTNMYNGSPAPSASQLGSERSSSLNGNPTMSNNTGEITQLPPQFRHLPPQMQQQVLFQLNQKKMALQQQQQQQQQQQHYMQQQAQLRAQFQQQQMAAAAATSKGDGTMSADKNSFTGTAQNIGQARFPTGKAGANKTSVKAAPKSAGSKGTAANKTGTMKQAPVKTTAGRSGVGRGGLKTAAAKRQTKKQQSAKQQQQQQQQQPPPPQSVFSSSLPTTGIESMSPSESAKPQLTSAELTPADYEDIKNRLPKLPPLPKYTIVTQEPELIKLQNPARYWSSRLKHELHENGSVELLNYEQIVLKDCEMLRQISKERDGVSLNSKYGQSIKEYTGRFSSDLHYYQEVKKTRLETIENVKQNKPTKSIWGHGFLGYGNGFTDTETKVVTGDRNLTKSKRSLYYDDISKLYNQAMSETQENLVPIRLDFELEKDKFQLRDTFLINKNDDLTKIDEFVIEMLKDYKFKNYQEIYPIISNNIREQISEYQEDPFAKFQHLRAYSSAPSFNTASAVNRDGNIATVNSNSMTKFCHSVGDDIRIKINLDIIVGSTELVDILEWDISNPENSPEEFAQEMCKELKLPGEFVTAIAHQIREQIHMYHKALVLSGYQFDGNFVEDDEIRSKLLPLVTLDNVLRNSSDLRNYTPNVFNITPAELDRLDKDKERERDSRKRRRAGATKINYNVKRHRNTNANASDQLNDNGTGASSTSLFSMGNISHINNNNNTSSNTSLLNGALQQIASGVNLSSMLDGSTDLLSLNSPLLRDENDDLINSNGDSSTTGGLNFFKTPASVPNIFSNLLNVSGDSYSGFVNSDDKDDDNNNNGGVDIGMNIGAVTNSIISGLNQEDIDDLKPDLNEIPKTFRTLVPSTLLPGGYDLGPSVQSFTTKYEKRYEKRPDPFVYILRSDYEFENERKKEFTLLQENSVGVNDSAGSNAKYVIKIQFKKDECKKKLRTCNALIVAKINLELKTREEEKLKATERPLFAQKHPIVNSGNLNPSISADMASASSPVNNSEWSASGPSDPQALGQDVSHMNSGSNANGAFRSMNFDD